MSKSKTDDILTDDYVAELLAKEASDCSLKYSAMGLDGFKSDNKRPANQPKPNTRFLNNIIRDTNSHNRALLAKENTESKARLRDLERIESNKRQEEEQKVRRSKPGPGDTRKRMLGDIAAILGGPSKRRKADSSADERPLATASSGRQQKNNGSARDKEKERDTEREHRGRHYDSDSEERRRHRPHSRPPPREEKHRHRDSDPEHRSHRPHSRPRQEDKHRDRRSDSRERDRGRRGSDQPRREKSERHSKSSRHHRERRENREDTQSPKREEADDASSDSDPLDDLIGPAPPTEPTIRRRGRGANAASSGIDSRFAADYDPSADVSPEPDEPAGLGAGWDNAVEAFRDRQKWKQQGAERLRSAGFTDEQVRKWENGDRKDESDVKWNKAGAVREWDLSKVTPNGDRVSAEPEFGRLKGT